MVLMVFRRMASVTAPSKLGDLHLVHHRHPLWTQPVHYLHWAPHRNQPMAGTRY